MQHQRVFKWTRIRYRTDASGPSGPLWYDADDFPEELTRATELKRLTLWFVVIVCTGLIAWVAVAQQPVPVVTTSTLINAAGNGAEWLTYGHDYAETHFSPLTQINTKNVKRLSLAWSSATDAPQGTVEATPLMHNGVLYFILPWNVMVAVDARTGQTKWRWDPEVPREHIQGLCCGPVNRGMAIYNGRVYAGLLDGRVVALDQETGKLIWSTQDTVPGGDTILTSAVRVVKGKVIVGSSGAEQAVRGYFSAYDAETGKRVWRFYTVPGDPSKPFEHPELEMAAKTWTGEWWKWGGGGTVWDAMAYDPDADILYVGTGNGGPWNQNIRSPQGGDNLFLASIIAVKPDTGKMVWYFQEIPGETWDFTSTQPIILADLIIDGQERKVLMHAPKNGYFYVLDRITGKFISGKPFVKRMTWSMGLDKNGRPIEAPGARYTTDPIRIWPGAGGAHNWAADVATVRSRAWSTFQAMRVPPRTLRCRPINLNSLPDAAIRASAAEQGKFQTPLTRPLSRKSRADSWWPGIR